MIKATIICDSISEAGVRITTMELEYPRIIHSEFMTHRMFSRNAASSRAIPFEKMLKQLDGIPSRFGAANAGMQDKGIDHDAPVLDRYGDEFDVRYWWELSKDEAVEAAEAMYEAGFHKQVYNRLLEPFQMIKVVVTATEWDNFFWLRDDKMADPTLQELAGKMRVAYNESTPELLKAGEYHLPYVFIGSSKYGDRAYYPDETLERYSQLFTEDAIKVSAARCAAVSYRNEDYGLEKCLQLYDRLVGDERKHSSALEHQATPMKSEAARLGTQMKRSDWMNIPSDPSSWEQGISHSDRNRNLWSGNFKGWIQHRKTIVGENYMRQE